MDTQTSLTWITASITVSEFLSPEAFTTISSLMGDIGFVNTVPYPALVVWIDAHDILMEWTDLEAIGVSGENGPVVVYTLGWVIPDCKKDHVVVALNKTNDGTVCSGIAIPGQTVKRIIPVSDLELVQV